MERHLNELLLRLTNPQKSPVVRQQAADEMWPYTWGNDARRNMDAMMRIGAVPAMVDVLKDNRSRLSLRGRICNIFQNLATVDAYRDILIDEGAVPLVLGLFSSADDTDARGPAWGALGNMFTESGKEQAVAGGGVHVLIDAIAAWGSSGSKWQNQEELRYLAAALGFLRRSLVGHNQSGSARR